MHHAGGYERFGFRVAVSVALVVAFADAHAEQPGAADAPVAPDGAADDPDSTADDPDPLDGVVDEGWLLYDRAFEKLVAGDAIQARELLAAIERLFPDHPAAIQARSRISEIDDRNTFARPERSASPAPGDEPRDESRDEPRKKRRNKRPTEKVDTQPRAELALLMTAHGVLLGRDLCQALECVGVRAEAVLLLSGGGAGLAGSLYFTRDGITQGHAQLINSAITWGIWNGMWYSDGIAESSDETAVEALAQLGGLGAGIGLWYVWHPSSGEVAMANTAGSWAAVLVALGHGLFDTTPDFGTVVVASDVGLALGAYMSQYYPMSRGRTLLIDTGGILGLLLGGLVAVASEADSDRGVLTPMFIGAAAGLAISAGLTHSWDVETPAGARLGVVPMGRRGWGAAVSLEL